MDRFAAALREKLHAAEQKYNHHDAWVRDDWADDLRRELRRHVEKGDPRDVAAYCAFAWHHGWSLRVDVAPTDAKWEAALDALDDAREAFEHGDGPADAIVVARADLLALRDRERAARRPLTSAQRARLEEIRARRTAVERYAPAPWSARYEDAVGGLVVDGKGCGLVHLHDERLTRFLGATPQDVDFLLELAEGAQ